MLLGSSPFCVLVLCSDVLYLFRVIEFLCCCVALRCVCVLSFVSLVSLVFIYLSCVCVFPLVKLRPLHTKNNFYLSPLYRLTDFVIFQYAQKRDLLVWAQTFFLHADSKTFKHRLGAFSEGRQ